MKKFIALYYNTSGAHQPNQELTEEQKQQMLAPWGVWAEKCGTQLIDMGSPFAPASFSGNGEAWQSSKHFVTGYSMVQAESLEAAQKLFHRHPIYAYPDHAIEISECVPM